MSHEIKIFCAGLIGWDNIGRTDFSIKQGADLPGSVSTSVGGVIANIAIALKKNSDRQQDIDVTLLSSVGDDNNSDALLSLLAINHDININYIVRNQGTTDGYIAIEAQGKLFGAIASSLQIEASCIQIFEPLKKEINSFSNYLIIDSNLTDKSLDFLTTDHFFDETPFIIACASPAKAKKVRTLLIKRKCIIYANLEEACEIIGSTKACSSEAANALFDLGAREAIVTNGKNKVSIRTSNATGSFTPIATTPSKITGAGDVFLATHFLSKLTNKMFGEEQHLELAAMTARKNLD